MLIVHSKDAFVRPHKHIQKSESVHVIEGVVDVVVFDNKGEIKEVIEMGDYASGRSFYYRMQTNDYHTFLIRSNFLVFHETVNGPFNKNDTLFPDWAPREEDIRTRAQYLVQLEERIEDFQVKI